MIPKLQVALDNVTTTDALSSVKLYGDVIDIIEVGTILCVAEGMTPVRILRSLYEDKIILADIKGADAGSILAKLCYDAGATWITAICSADVETMKGMLKTAQTFGADRDVQIELYGDWTFELAQSWLDAGLSQVVYHRSRDAQAAGKSWGESDVLKVKQLCEMGFRVTITGGLEIEDLHLFKDYPIYCIIAGRSIRDAKDPRQAALDFKAEINRLWKKQV